MNIESKGFKIEMTHGELWETAWDVRSALEKTLREHWVNHQKAWEENEKGRLERLKIMFESIGRYDLYANTLKMADDIFTEFNDKKKCGQ